MSETDKKALVLLALLGYICALGACATVPYRRMAATAPAFEQVAYGQGYLDGHAAALEECRKGKGKTR